MTTIKIQIWFILICLFNPVRGHLTITSSAFECGKTGSIVCSRTTENVTFIRWSINGKPGQFCQLNSCDFPSYGNNQYSADNGVWTLTAGQVERKDSNITYSCEAYSSTGGFLSKVSRTTNVSVVIDNSSNLTTYENDTDTMFMAESNCIKPTENVRITMQCVMASDENIIDSYCRPTSPSTYTSECNDLNETCAGPGTYRKRSFVRLATYRGSYFKFVKIKAVFTDGTNIIKKISADVKHETPPRIAPLRDCSVIENSNFSVNCSLSSGDPSTVKCTWVAPSGRTSNNCTLWIPTVQRTSSGTFTCRVENSIGNDTLSFYLDIMCTIGTVFFYYTTHAGNLLSINNIGLDQSHTCTASNEMKLYNGSTVVGESRKTVNIEVIYPPSVQTLKHQSIIEGSYFSQICNATPGRPIETNYLWTRRNGHLSENKRVLTITNVSLQHADDYTCTVWNYLNPSYGPPSNGTDAQTFTLEILYRPKLKAIPNQKVTEGSSFSQNCELLRHGNPTGKIMWFSLDQACNEMPIKSVNGSFTIANVSRNDEGSFKCVTENSMEPTDKEMVKGTDFKIFYLNVFYKTVISYLTIDDTYDRLVVNENKADVQFKCNVSSNPLSQVSLYSDSHSGSRILKEDPSSDHLLYSLSTASCWDSGEYTCSGRNNVTKNTVSKSVKLLVECTARPLHQAEPIITVYRGIGDDVTLKLTVVAYPIPASELFQWSRLEKEHSITHLNGSIVILSDSSLESKLSLTNIQDADFGQYKVAIRYNDILTAYVQYFSIQPQAIADSRSPNNGAIIGGAVGGGTVVIVVVNVVVVFLRRKAAAKSRRSADPQRHVANEHDLNDLTTGTQEPNGPNEYYNISSNPYEEVRICSSSGPYEDLNRCSGTNHEYSTLNRISDDKTTTHLPTVKTYENLQLKPLR